MSLSTQRANKLESLIHQEQNYNKTRSMHTAWGLGTGKKSALEIYTKEKVLKRMNAAQNKVFIQSEEI